MKKLYRSRTDRLLGGVCGGLGEYCKKDPAFIRLLSIFLCIVTGVFPMLLAYLAALFIIPKTPLKERDEISYKRLYRSREDRILAGICGGISKLLHWDSSFTRLFFLILCFITGFVPFLLTYLIGWMIIPLSPESSFER